MIKLGGAVSPSWDHSSKLTIHHFRPLCQVVFLFKEICISVWRLKSTFVCEATSRLARKSTPQRWGAAKERRKRLSVEEESCPVPWPRLAYSKAKTVLFHGRNVPVPRHTPNPWKQPVEGFVQQANHFGLTHPFWMDVTEAVPLVKNTEQCQWSCWVLFIMVMNDIHKIHNTNPMSDDDDDGSGEPVINLAIIRQHISSLTYNVWLHDNYYYRYYRVSKNRRKRTSHILLNFPYNSENQC